MFIHENEKFEQYILNVQNGTEWHPQHLKQTEWDMQKERKSGKTCYDFIL